MLGIEYRVVHVEQQGYVIRLPDGGVLVLEDYFFQAAKNDNYLHISSVPEQVERLSFQGEDFVVLFGLPVISTSVESAVPKIHCGVDIMASTFFMLSRWEEYVLPDRDEHGRFPAKASLAMRHHFLDRPVVNEWADLLWMLLRQAGWQQPRPIRKYQLSVSCDVDHPRLWWSPAARLKTLLGSILQRQDFGEAKYWFRKYLFQPGDPYDVFDEWMDIFEQHNLKVQFNFLGSRAVTSDCYYPLNDPFIRKTIQKMAARGHGIGFHPSYEAFEQKTQFRHELDTLRQLSPVPVTTGRQHYLRFAAPDTWRVWEDNDMAWDSTLGYSESEGFRCGMCYDFPVFDFLERKMLALREKPLLAMDVTLALYQKYTPEQATARLHQLRQQVRKHQGEFVFLWHNSSWNTYFWAKWKKVFLQFIAT